jgi:hypothetical protein
MSCTYNRPEVNPWAFAFLASEGTNCEKHGENQVNKHRFRVLDYLAPSIALVASVVAVIGTPKWNDEATGLSKLTSLGWITLIVGVLAFIATCIADQSSISTKLFKPLLTFFTQLI